MIRLNYSSAISEQDYENLGKGDVVFINLFYLYSNHKQLKYCTYCDVKEWDEHTDTIYLKKCIYNENDEEVFDSSIFLPSSACSVIDKNTEFITLRLYGYEEDLPYFKLTKEEVVGSIMKDDPWSFWRVDAR